MSDKINQTSYGYEITWANKENYNAKILVFNKAGSKTPFGFQKEFNKSIFVNSGSINVKWINTDDGNMYQSQLNEGGVFDIIALQPFSIEALKAETSITQVSNGDVSSDFLYMVPKEE